MHAAPYCMDVHASPSRTGFVDDLSKLRVRLVSRGSSMASHRKPVSGSATQRRTAPLDGF